MCNYCGGKGHLGKVCNQKKKDTNQRSDKARRLGIRIQLMDQEDYGEKDEEDYMVLNVDGSTDDTRPYYREGFLKGNRFTIMIDTGPVTILALVEAKRIMQRDKFHVREMIEGIKNDWYVQICNGLLRSVGYAVRISKRDGQFISKIYRSFRIHR